MSGRNEALRTIRDVLSRHGARNARRKLMTVSVSGEDRDAVAAWLSLNGYRIQDERERESEAWTCYLDVIASNRHVLQRQLRAEVSGASWIGVGLAVPA